MNHGKKLVALAQVALVLALVSSAFGQVNSARTPRSFGLNLSASVPTITMAAVDNAAMIAEDQAELEAARPTGERVPFRSAIPIAVNLHLNNSGNWQTLPNGDRLWQLRIVSPSATDLCLHYDRWLFHKPCELFLYSDDRSQVLGPYTYIDNWDGTNITPIMTGNAVTLEYWVPAGADQGELSIQAVLHGYRHMFNRAAREANPLDVFGSSAPCHVNIDCYPALEDDKNSVAMIFNPGTGRWCSGAMLNNTAQDGAPNFLTADHCYRPNVNNWLFYFKYESAECTPTTDGPLSYVITNASVLSRWSESDFMLLRLSRPRPEAPFIPRFAGWYRDDIPAYPSYGIHHPAGDVKKGAYDTGEAVSSEYGGVLDDTHWEVEWDLGVTEGGSSGSPLLDENFRVVGQLHGGASDCVIETEETDSYGKLSSSWNGDGTASGRVRDYLDPINNGANFVDAFQPTAPLGDSCEGGSIPFITTTPYSHNGSTQWAAQNSQSSSSPDVVYRLQFPCDYNIAVSTCGGITNFDTEIHVYRTTPICDTSGPSEGDNDDYCGAQSRVDFVALAGHIYSVWVSGYASAWGNYTFSVNGGPVAAQPTGLCPGITVDAIPYFTFTDNFCAQDDHVCPCRPNGGNDVVYNWVSPYSQQMRAKTCNTNFDTVLDVVLDGICTSGGTSQGCSDDACGSSGLGSSVDFYALTGATYWFHIDGYNGAEGVTSFEVVVANDNCSAPVILPGLYQYSTGDTRGARDDFATVYGPASKEVFFQYTSPTCQNLSFSTCGLNGFDTAIEIRTGGPCPGTTIVALSDDACGTQSNTTWGADANRTYYIIVGGYADSYEGPFWYNFEPHGSALTHFADVCPGIQINSLPFTDYGSTTCMAANYTNCETVSSRDVVYEFMIPTCQTVTVSLCGSNFDTELGVYSGTCPNFGTPVDCNDDNMCGEYYVTASTIVFTAQANTPYQFLVHGHNSAIGNFALNVTGEPCAIEPPLPPDDVVAGFDPGSGDVGLAWSAVDGAAYYNVYRSSNSETLFEAQNVIAQITELSYVCAGCINDPDPISFFGVIADNQVGPAPVRVGRDVSMLTKESAVQCAIVQNNFDALATPVEVTVSK